MTRSVAAASAGKRGGHEMATTTPILKSAVYLSDSTTATGNAILLLYSYGAQVAEIRLTTPEVPGAVAVHAKVLLRLLEVEMEAEERERPNETTYGALELVQ